jgi:GTP-binding protein HflX
VTDVGLDRLRAEIEQRLNRARHAVEVEIGPQDGALANWIYERCEVIARDELDEGAVSLRIRVAPEQRERLAQLAGPRIKLPAA